MFDILLTAIREKMQGRGFGSRLVDYLKQLALQQATAHGIADVMLLVQADNDAMDFWSRQARAPGPLVSLLVVSPRPPPPRRHSKALPHPCHASQRDCKSGTKHVRWSRGSIGGAR